MEKNVKTKDFPILFKKNYKDWFKRAEVKIKGKGAYYSIESSRTKYIWIHKKGGAADVNKKGKPNTEKAIIINTIDNSKVDNFTNKFKQMRGLWNIENAEKWN